MKYTYMSALLMSLLLVIIIIMNKIADHFDSCRQTGQD